jgi:hypothetical protein
MENTKRVILLSAQAHSGKDTLCDHAIKYLSNKNINTKVLVLADKVKILTRMFIKMFKGVELPLENFYSLDEKERVRPELGYIHNPGTGEKELFSIRRCMQTVGTDVLRKHFNDNIWVDYIRQEIFKHKNDYDVFIVPDVRFENEQKYLKNLDYAKPITIKILRNAVNDDLESNSKMHVSETGVLDIKCDHTINNNGSLDEYYKKIEDLLDLYF